VLLTWAANGKLLSLPVQLESSGNLYRVLPLAPEAQAGDSAATDSGPICMLTFTDRQGRSATQPIRMSEYVEDRGPQPVRVMTCVADGPPVFASHKPCSH
jgi:hypothetical protein